MTPQEIDRFKERLTPELKVVYEEAAAWWKSPEGKKAIRERKLENDIPSHPKGWSILNQW